MSRRDCCVIVLAVLSMSLPGCGLIRFAQEMSRDSVKMLRPNPNGYGSYDSTKESDGEWVEVGNMTRSMRPQEKDNDPLRHLMLDPKSISIERSLGIE